MQRSMTTPVVKQSTHESFTRDEPTAPGSDRTFGLVMAAALAVVSLMNGWHFGRLWPWTSVIAVLFAVAAWLRPSSLRLLNGLWMKLGLLLHKVVNPVVMGLLFFGTILPTGLVMRCGARTCCGSSASRRQRATGLRVRRGRCRNR